MKTHGSFQDLAENIYQNKIRMKANLFTANTYPMRVKTLHRYHNRNLKTHNTSKQDAEKLNAIVQIKNCKEWPSYAVSPYRKAAVEDHPFPAEDDLLQYSSLAKDVSLACPSLSQDVEVSDSDFVSQLDLTMQNIWQHQLDFYLHKCIKYRRKKKIEMPLNLSYFPKFPS